MNLILYVHQDASEDGDTFKKIIAQNFSDVQIDSFHTFNMFKAKLKKKSLYNEEIFILFAETENRLKELFRLIDLLENKRIILILPDQSKTTVSAALNFYPRYFTQINNSYNDLCAVLNKMIFSKDTTDNDNKGGIKDVSRG
jgi:hypothetical protein